MALQPQFQQAAQPKAAWWQTFMGGPQNTIPAVVGLIQNMFGGGYNHEREWAKTAMERAVEQRFGYKQMLREKAEQQFAAKIANSAAHYEREAEIKAREILGQRAAAGYDTVGSDSSQSAMEGGIRGAVMNQRRLEDNQAMDTYFNQLLQLQEDPNDYVGPYQIMLQNDLLQQQEATRRNNAFQTVARLFGQPLAPPSTPAAPQLFGSGPLTAPSLTRPNVNFNDFNGAQNQIENTRWNLTIPNLEQNTPREYGQLMFPDRTGRITL